MKNDMEQKVQLQNSINTFYTSETNINIVTVMYIFLIISNHTIILNFMYNT